MLADALRAETYRLSKNRTILFWSVLVVTSVTILFGAGMFALSGLITNLAKRRSVRKSHDSTTTGVWEMIFQAHKLHCKR